MEKTDPGPPPPITLADRVRAIPANASILLEKDERVLNSVRSTITRIKAENPGREFTTRMTDDGVRVWRLS